MILDVVYNHTCEGNEKGPTLSFKGIDNASYYRLLPDQKRFYINDTGTGNTLNLSNARVIQMVMDSLRYWVTEMHVDGFRFDLGTILARETYGFDQESGFLRAVGQDPVLSQVKMITEPWDCGPGGYQVGGFPPGWAEWNDRYRDNMRAYWKGDSGKIKDFATRFTGSSDFFNKRGRPAWSSVNFLTAHDGFTLNDWASYNEKHNDANGEGNNDGNSNNESWNCGAEGPTDDPARSTACASGRSRTCWPRLLLSRGTPMLLAGDEFGRTQRRQQQRLLPGQRDKLAGLGSRGEGPQPGPLRLPPDAHCAAACRSCTAPASSRPSGTRNWASRTSLGSSRAATTWIRRRGTIANTRCIGILLDGRAQASGIRRRGSDATVLVVMNSYHDGVPFNLPHVVGGLAWRCAHRHQPGRRPGRHGI